MSRLSYEWNSGPAPHIMLSLDEKYARLKINRDRNWNLRMGEIALGLKRVDSSYPGMIVHDDEFGRPEHLMYVEPLRMNRADAARKFLAASKKDPNYAWTPGLVELLDSLPNQDVDPLLPKLWERGGLEESLIP